MLFVQHIPTSITELGHYMDFRSFWLMEIRSWSRRRRRTFDHSNKIMEIAASRLESSMYRSGGRDDFTGLIGPE
jgi:hypothetical protein